jgi:hypothetical protein
MRGDHRNELPTAQGLSGRDVHEYRDRQHSKLIDVRFPLEEQQEGSLVETFNLREKK